MLNSYTLCSSIITFTICAVNATGRLLRSSARLAQSVEHETLNLRVVGSSPTLGGKIFFFLCFFLVLFYYYGYFILFTKRNIIIMGLKE